MAEVTNNTVRLINIGGYMCVPGTVTNVPDEFMTNARIAELTADGSLSTGAPPPEGGEGNETLGGAGRGAMLQRPVPPSTQHPATPPQRTAAQPPVTRAQPAPNVEKK